MQYVGPSFMFCNFIFLKYALALFLREIGYVSVNKLSVPHLVYLTVHRYRLCLCFRHLRVRHED